MTDYTEEREALKDARRRLDEVLAEPGSRERMYLLLCDVLAHLSNKLESYENYDGPMDNTDVMVLATLEDVQNVITKGLG